MANQLQQYAAERLSQIDPSLLSRFVDGSIHDLMAKLRRDAPVHYCEDSPHGPYWSITKHRDIIEIEAVPAIFSSDSSRGGIAIIDASEAVGDQEAMRNFIAMDAPEHTDRRRTVAPAFTPSEMQRLSEDIQSRSARVLDALPRGEEFNWVEHVSIPLTRDMLAILFDYPWEQRHKLIEWSDAITSFDLIEKDPQKRMGMIFEMATEFHKLWAERSNCEPASDLISMMIHSDAMGQMEATEFLGNMALLIVGGNDTTRNSMSAVIAGFSEFPGEWQKVLDDESLVANAASELIRWQSPVAHMRRTVVEDTEFRGHHMRAGDKVVLWYVSANRDEALFEDGDRLDVTRKNARRHLSFGYGVHRCVGARLAELQVQTLLSEMRERQLMPKLVGDIGRSENSFINGVTHLPVSLDQ